MFYFHLKGTYNNHLAQLPDHFRAYHILKDVIKGLVQMPLKYMKYLKSIRVRQNN